MKFRKKPVVIEAIRWMGDNLYDVVEFVTKRLQAPRPTIRAVGPHGLMFQTVKGEVQAQRGDWIICGVNGEFESCAPDIFEATHEPVDA